MTFASGSRSARPDRRRWSARPTWSGSRPGPPAGYRASASRRSSSVARELIVVDPGDPSPDALAAILGVAAEAGGTIGAIVITSPDPARAAGADELSERTGATVFGPPGSAAWLPFPVVERPGQPADPLAYRAWLGLGAEPT